MENKAKAMVLASFAADSLALGAHWIYDTAKIEKAFGRVDALMKPPSDSYHPTKDKGEFTQYGDQAFVLLESIASKGGFDLEDFSRRWRDLFKSYHGYFDQATRTTLQNLSRGKSIQDAGSLSSDLAGASRIAPLVMCYRDDLDTLVDASRAQTKITHNNPAVIDSAEFFARVSWNVLHGISPLSAMKAVASERFESAPLSEWLQAGIESKENESINTIIRFGQSCHVEDAFAGVVHLIAKYENALKEALVQSVMAGGDSAGRGMIVGMVLGARLGPESLPPEWIAALKREREILKLLDMIH